MPGAGLEPARLGQQSLNLPRLPFRHPGKLELATGIEPVTYCLCHRSAPPFLPPALLLSKHCCGILRCPTFPFYILPDNNRSTEPEVSPSQMRHKQSFQPLFISSSLCTISFTALSDIGDPHAGQNPSAGKFGRLS